MRHVLCYIRESGKVSNSKLWMRSSRNNDCHVNLRMRVMQDNFDTTVVVSDIAVNTGVTSVT